jgi:hypothetical protein
MISLSEKYRLKALNCEKLGREAADASIKAAWTEIAIEWHALANRTSQESSPSRELEAADSAR